MLSAACLLLALQQAAELPPAPPAGAAGPLFAHLGRAEGDEPGLQAIARAFAQHNPGYTLEFVRERREFAAGGGACALFLQSGAGEAEVSTGGETCSSPVEAGAVVLLRAGERLTSAQPLSALVIHVPEPPPAALPSFVRPDWDPRITDTPGGCATDQAAYRRLCLTWDPSLGPYIWHVLNAHRVRITDSFTHYHPPEGGFDEFYLVQGLLPGGTLLTSTQRERLLQPETITAEECSGLLQPHPLAVGDLVYLPRGVVHRGLGGALVQVITVPGFVPGAELGVDAQLRAIDARLGCALPFHATLVSLRRLDDRLRIELDGRLCTEYRWDGFRPSFYPLLLGAQGLPMTRHWPFEEAPDEEHDHPHHRSLWFGHGSVNGADFWAGANGERIVLTDLEVTGAGPDAGSFTARHEWRDGSGGLVLTDEQSWSLQVLPAGFLLSADITLHASAGPLVFGDTKEGAFGLRLAETLRLKGAVAAGHMQNGDGVRDGEVWGKRSDWVDDSGPVAGQTAGVALFDHPGNPRHPTWWHARDYGLIAANPFGVHDFVGAPAGTGELRLAQGESLRLRYACYFHLGDAGQAGVAEQYRAWAGR